MNVIRRTGPALMVLLPLSIHACSLTGTASPQDSVAEIHSRATVIDAHAHPKGGASPRMRLGERTGEIEVDFPDLKEGGVDAIFFSVPLLGSSAVHSSKTLQILGDLDSLSHEVSGNSHQAEVATSPADLGRIVESGKIAVLMSVEMEDPFEGDLRTIERLHRAGVRMITLGTLDSPDPSGRARWSSGPPGFEGQAIREMNRLGIIMDISHLNDSLQMDVIRNSAYPVVASHSCARGLNDAPREMSDSVLTALAERGGVIGVTFFPGHISSDFPDEQVSVEDLVDHVDHIVKVVGVDHVGFGSDFLGSDTHTIGLESAAGLPSLTRALLSRGYSEREVGKILGGNLLRVFEVVSGT